LGNFKRVKMKFLAIIPARYGSTRFPGKPLADIGGKLMIKRVYEQCSKVFNDVYVATDDQRILDAVENFGGRAVLTSTEHPNGTSRVLEAMYKIEALYGEKCECVINVQGDEPFIEPTQIRELISCFDTNKSGKTPETEVATLAKKFLPGEDIFNPNTPKVVFGKDGAALYFSRSAIPFVRDREKDSWVNDYPFFRHIGLYGYRREALIKIAALEPTPLESAESLEQLRWLENGIRIVVAETSFESHSIDTPTDIELLKLKGVI
jgi:3-deoxy-manno-octulosonate cytidylyltransferase (CMP-KDO synthetase)